MKTWTIEGADKTTGKERVMTVEAMDEKEAAIEASAAGLLVSAVHELPPAPPAPKPAKLAKSAYQGIVRGAGTLDVVASLLMIIGWVSIAIGAIGVVAGFGQLSHGEAGFAIGAGVGAIINGIVMVVASTLISMFAALALAVRDIAVNSAK